MINLTKLLEKELIGGLITYTPIFLIYLLSLILIPYFYEWNMTFVFIFNGIFMEILILLCDKFVCDLWCNSLWYNDTIDPEQISSFHSGKSKKYILEISGYPIF